jgi:hypothetical protein
MVGGDSMAVGSFECPSESGAFEVTEKTEVTQWLHHRDDRVSRDN